MAGKTIKGITIEIGGDSKKLGKALEDVNKKSSSLQTELNSVNRLLKFNPEDTVLLAQKQELLGQQVETTAEKLKRLKDVQEQVEQQFKSGDIGAEQYRDFQREIVATEGKLKHLDSQLEEINNSSVEGATKDLKKMEAQAEKTESAVSKIGSGLSSAVKGIGAGAAAGGAAIGSLVVGMQEYNMDLARLKTNASNAGFELEGVQAGFEKIAAVTGETDSAVETMSNLMQTGFSDEQLSSVIDEINGAAIRFSDTLKTEGIADGLQETFATGSAIGQFGELLERSGVDLDKFNEGLATAKKNGTETDYVMQQLADLGLSSAYDEYKQLNPEIVAQQEAQQKMTAALAELATVLTPIVTMATEFLTKIIQWANENINLMNSFDSISEGLSAILPGLLDKGIEIVTNIVDGIVQALPGLIDTALTLIPKIVEALTGLLPKVLDAGIQILLSLIQGIADMLPELAIMAMELIMKLVDTLIKNLPEIIQTGVEILVALIEGIAEMLPELIKMIYQLILDITVAIIENLPLIIEAGIQILTALIEGILSMSEELVEMFLTEIIPMIVDTLTELDLYEIGKDIIWGLINGIGSMAKILWDAVKNLANGILNSIKQTLGIASPSKVMADEVGKWIPAGLADGIKKNLDYVINASNQMAQVVIPTLPRSTNVMPQMQQAQPAYINVNLGGRDYEVFVDDVTRTQNRKSHLKRKYSN